MNIIEINYYYVDYSNKTLEVNFKTDMDNDDEYRSDKVFFTDIEEFGLYLIPERKNVLDYDYDSDEYQDEDDDIVLDMDILMDFLNQYYVLYPDKLPNVDF